MSEELTPFQKWCWKCPDCRQINIIDPYSISDNDLEKDYVNPNDSEFLIDRQDCHCGSRHWIRTPQE